MNLPPRDLDPHPNTIPRPQLAADTPSDTMNDPSAILPQAADNASNLDPDACRICRGEGTADEPLFYPCKCSGSIKYVHQDCLMEWLSHSQKKHCELCKTPFRFTKLYSPDMPKRLPLNVFISHMTRYLFRKILFWLRAALVATVWLGCLPYCMRWVWSFLFWVSDEGFGASPSPLDPRNATSLRGGDPASVSVTGTGTTTCPSTPLLASSTTAATLGGAMDHLPLSSLLKAISKPLDVANHSWLRILFTRPNTTGSIAQQSLHLFNVSYVDKPAVSPVPHQHGSLLSDITILNNITRNPTINRTIVAVLEGQVITLLVIVCFILIILVRDYVVQQQPEINMRAAFAAAENDMPPAAAPLDAARQGPDPDDVVDNDNDSDYDSTTAVDGDGTAATPNELQRELENMRLRPIAGFRRRPTRQDDDEPVPESGTGAGSHTPASPITTPGALGHEASNPSVHTSDQHLVNELLSSRTEHGDHLRRRTGNDGQDTSQTTVKEYLRIYREAGGDRERILQTIQDEGLEYRLRYWVRVTHAMAAADGPSAVNNRSNPASAGPVVNAGTLDERDSNQSFSISGSLLAHGADSDSSSWTWAESEDGNDANDLNREKGKGRAEGLFDLDESADAERTSGWPSGPRPGASSTEDAQDASDSPALLSSRPRAVSDGPQHHEAINPLANNNWSFSGIPAERPPQAEDISDVAGFSLTPSTGQSASSLRTTEVLTPASVGDEIASPSVDAHAAQITHALPSEPVETRQIILDSHHEDANASATHHPTPDEVGEGAYRGEGALDVGAAPNAVAQRPGSIVDRMADFMWGDVHPGPADEIEAEEAVDIFGDNQNAPFMDDGGDGDDDEEDELDLVPDVMEAAVAAGLDPEAIEDAEDFEGIMELIGMRGPVAGLLQNAIFCALLVSITIFMGIFAPYNIGRVTVWTIANPTRLIRMAFSFAKSVQDGVLLVGGYSSTVIFTLIEGLRLSLRMDQGKHVMRSLILNAKHISAGAFDRIASSFMSEIPLISASEMRNFSAISHEALIRIKGDIFYAASAVAHLMVYLFGGNYAAKWTAAKTFANVAGSAAVGFVKSIPGIAVQPGTWVINLQLPEAASAVDPNLVFWSSHDRAWAVVLGYLSLSVLAGLYLRRGTPFSTGQTAQEWEASIIDALNQASGVMKVILIISIEMLVFPLYCGLLLDFALLPLFENTSLKSRLLFTYNHPLTSMFVHWFVGTGYMFHFALFVSMCRKIMRKGVLYFIRDPDDPEFHPVRDVLERNVTTQLRKILFSAFVYGALVVVCLGGVVWGLSLTLPDVLPIHYSSNEPVLEFPIDLLFYNFLMPLAVKFFKPGDGLHAMYTWWFRTCARGLRLTWFLFGERRVDEEGKLTLKDDSPHRNLPWWRRVFLEVDNQNRVIPKTWHDLFDGGKAKPSSKIPAAEMGVFNIIKKRLVDSGQLITNGRFVRSPASDQVKIPKGQAVFLDVSEQDTRKDGKPDRPDTDLYSGIHYQFVYVPPLFRARIFLFILFIWMFAAITGVGFTIVPLVFGRRMFKVLIPSHIRTNDIYAFSIGIYVLGSIGYFVFHLRSVLTQFRVWGATAVDSMLDRRAIERALRLGRRAARIFYTYTVLLIIFPLLITLLVELYVLMPLHTYMYATGTETPSRFGGLRDGHTIRVIQAWTLGILYLKLGSRALTLYGGRPAHAVRAVLRQGWLYPDVGVLTRAFVIPGVTASLVMIFMPPIIAWAAISQGVEGDSGVSHEMQVLVFRLAYPVTALFWAGLLITRNMVRVFGGWQVRIRDEAYLIGERLHNFGGTSSKVSVWRGSARL
ncbi:Uu.00g061990.m01.CDS01 [Anthostomella pinea]|uniref:RING-type E3 ubiquitin transferase n=1 Tax=Anthostomella pinea TaxID=933095 RepID=A0AAI8VT79_9PEZI|nr:Uu.00g061990.m01.CDS01 [Anthostomella pinea]